MKLWDPTKNEAVEWDGREVTVGEGAPHRRVTPRLVGPATDNFKSMWGVCPHDGCARLASDCTEHKGM